MTAKNLNQKININLQNLLNSTNNLGLTEIIVKPPYYDPSFYYASCRNIPMYNLPQGTGLTNYIMIHRPEDIGTIYTSKPDQDLNLINQRLNQLAIGSTMIFTYIVANDIDRSNADGRILYFVEILDAFEYGSKHTQIISYIDNTSKSNINVYLAGEIQITKSLANRYDIEYNFDSGSFRLLASNLPPDKRENFRFYLYNFFNMVLADPLPTQLVPPNSIVDLQMKFSDVDFQKPRLNVKKLNKMCKRFIKIRSKIPHFLASRANCSNPVINYPNQFYNYSYINPTDRSIENFKNNDKLLCDTVLKYYIRPKFGLSSTKIQKYNIDPGSLDFDDIHTDPLPQDPDTLPELMNTMRFMTFFFKQFNSYFDINDYQRIDQRTSLLPNDSFNTRLYDNIMMAVLNKYNIEYIRKYATLCLKNYTFGESKSINNLADKLDIYPPIHLLVLNNYTDNRTNVYGRPIALSPILPYYCNKAYNAEPNIDNTDPFYATEISQENNIYFYTKENTNIQYFPAAPKRTLNIVKPKHSTTLRILSFNVHNWIRVIPFDNHTQPNCNPLVPQVPDIYGTSILNSYLNRNHLPSTGNEDKQYRSIKPFIKFFDSTNADIVFLQEITPMHNRPNPHIPGTYLPVFPQRTLSTYADINNQTYNFKLINQEMAKLGYFHKFIANTLFKRLNAPHENSGFFWLGNAIYSKHKLIDPVSYKLNYNRICIFATIIFNNTKYIIATLHLSYFNEAPHVEQASYKQQLSSATGLLANYMLKQECSNVILGGDFNHPLENNDNNLFNSILLKEFGKGYLLDLMDKFNRRYFTGFHNRQMIDRFLVSPNITKFHNYETGIIKTLCSDHYPIYLDITAQPNINLPLPPDTLYDPSLPLKTYNYLDPIFANKYDILNTLPLILYDNMTYASDKHFQDIHYGLSLNVLQKIIYEDDILSNNNIPLSMHYVLRKSLITVVQPEYKILDDEGNRVYQLIALHNNLNIIISNMVLDALNINNMDYRTMAVNPTIDPDTNFPENSIRLIQNNDSTDKEILPSTFDKCKLRIKFANTNPLNPNIFNWIQHVPGSDPGSDLVPNLVALDITDLDKYEINRYFDNLVQPMDVSLLLYTKSMCNLVIIKFKDYYIYLHNIGYI